MSEQTNTPRVNALKAEIESVIAAAIKPNTPPEVLQEIGYNYLVKAVALADSLERELSAAQRRVEELEADAKRYRGFRAMVSRGDLTNKPWKAAFDAWFARYYPESDLDALIDKALPNLIDAFNGDAPFPDITAALKEHS